MTRRRAFGATAGLLLVLAAAGALYQKVSERRGHARYPPPGRLVDVGGRRLHLLCIGWGQPTVIVEPGAFTSAVSFATARAAIGAHTRVCSYDRLGMGWSEPGPGRITLGTLTGDLERLLERATIPPPYILMPSSMGGLVAELYARRHPERIAGLVFVDAGHSGVLEEVAPRVTWRIMAAACVPKVIAQYGLLQLIDPLGLRRASARADQDAWRIYRVAPMTTLCALVSGITASVQEMREAPALAPDLPLAVLTAESTDGLLPPGFGSEAEVLARDWRDLQQALSRRTSHGTWQIVAGSTHLIAESRPRAVADTVLRMVDQSRSR